MFSKALMGLMLPFALTACGEEILPECSHTPREGSNWPEITAIEPTGGPAGSIVILSGSGFDLLDDSYTAAYGNFSNDCTHSTMEGTVISSTEIEVIIPEGATLSGYIYLVTEKITAARSPLMFELEPTGYVTISNRAQFPIVSVEARWQSLLETGDWIDINETRTFRVPTGILHTELCLGGRDSSGDLEEWSCESHDGHLDSAEESQITVRTFALSRFLAGGWKATWEEDDEIYEERLVIGDDGYWELRYDGSVVESGWVAEQASAPYAQNIEFSLRSEDPTSKARIPISSFSLLSPRAGDSVTFYRVEE